MVQVWTEPGGFVLGVWDERNGARGMDGWKSMTVWFGCLMFPREGSGSWVICERVLTLESRFVRWSYITHDIYTYISSNLRESFEILLYWWDKMALKNTPTSFRSSHICRQTDYFKRINQQTEYHPPNIRQTTTSRTDYWPRCESLGGWECIFFYITLFVTRGEVEARGIYNLPRKKSLYKSSGHNSTRGRKKKQSQEPWPAILY